MAERFSPVGEEWFRGIFEASPDPAWIIENRRFIDCNRAAVSTLRYPDKRALLGAHPKDLSPELQPCGEASAAKAKHMIGLAEERGSHRFEWTHRRADGSLFPTEVTLSAITLLDRAVVYCSWRDLSDHDRMAQALRESEQRFRDFTFASADWIWEVDARGRFTYVAGNVESVLGYTPAELIGRTPFDIMPLEEARRVRRLMKDIARHQRSFSDLHNVNLHKHGRLRHSVTNGMPIRDASGAVIGYRGIDRDTTALRERDEKILRLAYYDALTGLPNRILLEDRVAQALAAARRNQLRTALLFLDLDRFKVVNDSLGHDIGDQLLVIMSKRMQSVLRASDTLARLGGDEFVVVLGDVKDAAAIAAVAEKIIAEVARPVSLQGQEFNIGVSIGAAIGPDDGDNFPSLLKRADIAMYRAKADGKSTLRLFDGSMKAQVMRHLHLEGRLRKAIDNGDVDLHYQPKIRLPGGSVPGVEALIRWRLDGALVPAPLVISVADEGGLIGALGDLVLSKTLDQVRTWKAAGLPAPRTAVNFSAHQFSSAQLVDRMVRAVGDRGLAPQDLEVELTESVLMADQACDIVDRLHAAGFLLTLDDFGTGYSSLGYLKRLPIHTIKIDRSFIRDIASDHRSAALVEAILAIGRSLGLEVVAEGVETREQLRFLVDRDCTLFQGHLFSRPLAADALQQLLQRGPEAFNFLAGAGCA